MKKSGILILYILISSLVSCSSYKVIKESNTLSEQRKEDIEEKAQYFIFFIYAEATMKGEKLQVSDDRNFKFDKVLNDCPLINLGLCETIEVDNSTNVHLKIGNKSFLIPSYTFYDFRYLILSKEKNKIILKYTNQPILYR